MKERKVWKKAARRSLKKHYLLFVVICLAMSVLGVSYGQSTAVLQSRLTEDAESSGGTGVIGGMGGFDAVAEAILQDHLEQGDEIARENEETYQQESSGALGRSRGVLAQVVNGVTSGSILVTIAKALLSIFHSSHIMIMILIIVSMALALAWWIFFKNIIRVVAARAFLEGRTYESVPAHRFFFLRDTHTWGKTARTMLYMKVLYFLWSLTVVGAIIKRYSYYLVPYIAAENPEVSPKEAVALSRKMMDGHKWECFVLELSFIGWILLGTVTLGLTEILFSNPYRSAVFCEYYAFLRGQALEGGLEGSELLRDRYLYEKADRRELEKAYPLREVQEPVSPAANQNALRRFITDVLGIASSNSKAEQEWQAAEEAKILDKGSRDVLDGRIYPTRLSCMAQRRSRNIFSPERVHYIRHYSLSSLVLIFFAFSLVGWIWEVSLHLISDGTFVNRGALLGPWIPIYGSGAVLILVFLNFLRSKPIAEFTGTIVLCGFVEYFTSVYLEKVHDGMRWWDYTGYFLNLHGRICAEGLMVFGIGGMAIVYLLSPRFDSLMRRVPRKVRICLCIVLIILFAADTVYSSIHPNMGVGITSY